MGVNSRPDPLQSGTVLVPGVPASRPVLLIADDDDDQRFLLGTMFDGVGFDVITAADGEEACRLATSRIPSIILLDLDMPIVDGWEALRSLRSTTELSASSIFLLSGRGADPTVRQRALDAGCSGVFVKGSSSRALLAAVLEASREESTPSSGAATG